MKDIIDFRQMIDVGDLKKLRGFLNSSPEKQVNGVMEAVFSSLSKKIQTHPLDIKHYFTQHSKSSKFMT